MKALRMVNTMKTKKELNEIKEEIETLSRKLRELTDEELEQVTGGCLYKEYVCGQDFIPIILGNLGEPAPHEQLY